MTTLPKKIFQILVPQRLRTRLHVFRKFDDYILLPRNSITYGEDDLYSLRPVGFLDDPRFSAAYTEGEKTGSWHGTQIRWRAYVACWAAEHCLNLPGDFIECGVNLGGLARTIVEYVDFGHNTTKHFYLVDSFAGLSPDLLLPEERSSGLLTHYDYYGDTSSKVKETFCSFSNVSIIKGFVPDVLPQIPTEQVAFLSLDMNCTIPEIRAAEFFWERMPVGGIILLDDYGHQIHSAQKSAFDIFAKERGLSVLLLPTSQGLVIKTS